MKGKTGDFSIFQHDASDVLMRALLARFPGRKRPLSSRQLARELGYASPRIVEMVAQGARAPSRPMIGRLSERLRLSSAEHLYLELLSRKKAAEKKGLSSAEIVRKMESLRGPRYRKRALPITDFSHLSEWHYAPIQQLVACPGFREDSAWIAAKLGGAITPPQAAQAIRRLLELRLIERDARTGKLRYPDFEYVEATSPQAPSAAIRAHHAQMLARMSHALDHKPMHERAIFNLCLRFDPARLPEAKRAVQDFCAEMNRRFAPGQTDEVYQLGAYLFPHTEKLV